MDLFIEYIKTHGDEHCAEQFGVTRRAVASYRHGERRPRPAKAKDISARCGIPLHSIRPDVWDPPPNH